MHQEMRTRFWRRLPDLLPSILDVIRPSDARSTSLRSTYQTIAVCHSLVCIGASALVDKYDFMAVPVVATGWPKSVAC